MIYFLTGYIHNTTCRRVYNNVFPDLTKALKKVDEINFHILALSHSSIILHCVVSRYVDARHIFHLLQDTQYAKLTLTAQSFGEKNR